MRTIYTDANVILKDRIIRGYVVVENGVIQACGTGKPSSAGGREVALNGLYLSPGFVEMHSHGAGGCDFMDGTATAVLTAAAVHMSHGTTTLYPTTLAATRAEILGSIDALRAAREGWADGPHLPGLHMEGPYLNAAQKGAIDDRYIRNPDPKEYEEFLDYGRGAIARWTVAPELPGALEFASRLRAEGILPSMGHTAAEYGEILAGYEAGFTHVTHLYSAMSSMVRRGGFRYPGLIESAFCIEGLTVEVIADGCHLPPEMLRMVYRVMGVERVALTCDSMRCAGQQVSESILGSLRTSSRTTWQRCRSDGVCGQHRDGWTAGARDAGSGGRSPQDCVRMMPSRPRRSCILMTTRAASRLERPPVLMSKSPFWARWSPETQREIPGLKASQRRAIWKFESRLVFWRKRTESKSNSFCPSGCRAVRYAIRRIRQPALTTAASNRDKAAISIRGVRALCLMFAKLAQLDAPKVPPSGRIFLSWRNRDAIF